MKKFFPKFKLDKNSINVRLCWYFCLFAAFLLGMLWLLQIIFLNMYYQEMKISQTTRIAKMISEKFGTDDFLNSVYDAVVANDIYVQIEDTEGKYVLYSSSKDTGGRGLDIAYIPEMAAVKSILDENNSKNVDGASVIIDLKGERRVLAYANYIYANKKTEKAVMYIFSPLYPVESTVGILKNQLMYVSVISFGLAFILSIYLSDRISKPIRGITCSAKKLAKGNYGVIFDGGNYTEIIQLADTLNHASADLKTNETLRKDLIANVSHDLRTPLTMVKSYAELIRDISGDNEAKRNAHLQVILDEADRLNALVSDMVDLSCLQNRVTALNLKKTDLCSLTETFVESKELYASRDGYKILLELPEEPAYVMADENQIIRVMDNLFNNGVKYCGEDKTLIIKVLKVKDGIRWEITDHGMGIEYGEQEQIWDRYYKTSTNHVRATKGTGLGLAIVKEIILLHGGKYGLESIPSKGSTFFFEL